MVTATFICVLLFLSSMSSVMATSNGSEDIAERRNGEHKAASMWCLHPILGILGTSTNSFVLYMVYIERNTFISSINVMLWMETIYRLIISGVLIPWKSLLMGTNYTLFSSIMSPKMVCNVSVYLISI